MRRVLVTGGHGQLGRELCRFTWPDGWEAVALGRDGLDLNDAAAITDLVASRPWAAVINAGAYTAVDGAEGDVVAAWRLNALAPAALAVATERAAVPLVHVSTDYVFDGSRSPERAWEVDDVPAPLGVYGASKLGGELAVRTACARHAIVRTAWLVGAQGGNFVKTMLRVGAERATVRVVDDQWGSPTAAGDLAAALARIAMRLADDVGAPSGTFHFANAGSVTWCGLARAIFAGSAARGGPSAAVEAIATADYPTAARRPANSRLSSDALTRAYGIVPRPWQEALDPILDELIGPVA